MGAGVMKSGGDGGGGGRRRRRGRSQPMSEINVTPFVDVMLVLLIIFMVVTPILTQYEATPPYAMTATPEPDDDIITLGIDTEGAFFIENTPVADAVLATRLREELSSQPEGERLLYLRADRGASYARVLDAVEAARTAGVTTIGAITVPQDDAPPPRSGG